MLDSKYLFSLYFLSTLFGIAIAVGDTCSPDRKPQPIGIDLGHSTIISAYAHSSTNISTLSLLANPGPYGDHVFHLRWEDFQAKNLGEVLYGAKKKSKSYLTILNENLEPYLASVKTKFDVLQSHYPLLLDLVHYISMVSRPVKMVLLRSFGKGAWLDEDLTLSAFKTGLILALNETKAQALEKDNTTISFALISVPDFFNRTLCALVLEAAAAVGIETASHTVSRTVAAGMAGQAGGVLADEKGEGKGLRVKRDGGERMLVIEQGRFYAGMRTYLESPASSSSITQRGRGQAKSMERFEQRYLPLDPYGSQHVNNQLFQRVVARENVLQEELGRGADRARLMDEVNRARLLIKDNLDKEMMGKGEEEDWHHGEWPLELNGWGVSGGLGITLKWEDVEKVEDDFVEKFADAIYKFLVSLRLMREKSEIYTPETIHTAVVLTDYMDGGLIKRAINKALGPEVRIVGGTLSDTTLAAKGMAKLALRRVEGWEELYRKWLVDEFLETTKTTYGEL